MTPRPTFRDQIQTLIDEALKSGPPIAVMLALVEETRRVGIIAAALHDIQRKRPELKP